MIQFLSEFKSLFEAILPVLLLVWLSYRIGLKKYFQEKENELIIKRYLENGVDKVNDSVSHALSVHNENWRRALSLLKEYREIKTVGLKMRKTSLAKSFIKYDIKKLNAEPYYKIKALVDDDIYWNCCQLLYAFVGNSYEFFENDLKLAIDFMEKDKIEQKVSLEQFCYSYLKKCTALQEESFIFYKIQLELFNLSMDLEDILLGSGKLRFKDINKFKDRPNIKEGIKNLKNSFGKQIKEAGLKWDTNEIHNNSKPSSSNNST